METPGVGIPESCLDFSFGFDDPNFSDRILQLAIADTGPHTKKPRLAHTTTPPAPRVKTIHIDSLILAARSLFFRKLFSNGMQESGQKLVTLQIETSEEDSLMNLLKYAYSNTLPTTLHALLSLLVIADKFEVDSCLRGCTALLQNMPMTCESASSYLDLPPSLLMSPTIQPLVDAAKQFLIARFKNFDQCKEDILNMPLAGLQAVLSSDDLQVTSEGVVYNSVLKWARKHYPDSEERRGVLKTHLLNLVRFPFMTPRQLIEEVQTCSDIDPELASRIVTRALYFKSETPYQKRCLAVEEGNVVSRQFVERKCKYRPVKVVELESPQKHCIIYFHLTRKELRDIFPDGGEIMTETFHFGKHELVLVVEKPKDRFVFSLALKVVGSAETFPVRYDIAVRKKQSDEYISWRKGCHVFTEHERVEYVLLVPWFFINDNKSTSFVNDVLHLRAELTTEFPVFGF